MNEKLCFYLNRLKERLWVKPLIMCLLSVTGVFLAKIADNYAYIVPLPEVSAESLVTLLNILSSSMLVIAVFAVGSMIAAYTSASNTATPRSFPLIVADDVSQNALSAFIGAFIFSAIAQLALANSYYNAPGRFALLILTLIVFAIVIMTFVRWVDRIARLGRMGTTIDKVEAATIRAFNQRLKLPALGGQPLARRRHQAQPVYSDTTGYVKRIEMADLQALAERSSLRIQVEALPGSFVTPAAPIAYVEVDTSTETVESVDFDPEAFNRAFLIGGERTFDEDPRFGLVVLSEIASRSLSPGINDPGTAIAVIGTLVRIFALCTKDRETCDVLYNRIWVPEIDVKDMFDDAFSATARDGAGLIEVLLRLQKALKALSIISNDSMRDAAIAQARQVLARAEMTLEFPADLALIREASGFCSEQEN